MPVSTQTREYGYAMTMDGNCYTALQPVPLDLGSLITTSICLQEDSCGAYHTSVHYVASSCNDYYTDEPDISRSPESVYEEDLSDISEVLQRRMTGCKRDDDDDNESVVFDFGDLDFLDNGDRGEMCSRHHRSVIVTPATYPSVSHSGSSSSAYCCSPLSLSQTTASPLLAQTAVTPASSTSSSCSPSSTPSSPSSLTTCSASPYHLHGYQQQRGAQEPSSLWPPLYYEDPIYALPPYCQGSAAPAVRFPPTPSPSPSPRLQEGAGGLHCHHQQQQHHHHHHHHQQPPLQPLPSLEPTSYRTPEQALEDEEEDAEYKPYCDSRRGAKKNLLWKFLLWVLDNHTDLAQWTDVRRGIFKFVDTARVSNMWGQRKHKKDMTFEKLSRGIRHYYKRGLMERMSNTRLVYKFNWEKVPRRYRKF